MLTDNVHTGAVCPDLQLVGSGGAERITGAQQYLLALTLVAGGQLADGRGFAHAVDADDQHHAWLGTQVHGRVAHVQLLRQNIAESVLHLIGAAQQLLAHPLAQLRHRIGGGGRADVRQDQRFLQFLVKVVVQPVKGHGRQPCFLEFLEKSHVDLLI